MSPSLELVTRPSFLSHPLIQSFKCLDLPLQPLKLDALQGFCGEYQDLPSKKLIPPHSRVELVTSWVSWNPRRNIGFRSFTFVQEASGHCWEPPIELWR